MREPGRTEASQEVDFTRLTLIGLEAMWSMHTCGSDVSDRQEPCSQSSPRVFSANEEIIQSLPKFLCEHLISVYICSKGS